MHFRKPLFILMCVWMWTGAAFGGSSRFFLGSLYSGPPEDPAGRIHWVDNSEASYTERSFDVSLEALHSDTIESLGLDFPVCCFTQFGQSATVPGLVVTAPNWGDLSVLVLDTVGQFRVSAVPIPNGQGPGAFSFINSVFFCGSDHIGVSYMGHTAVYRWNGEPRLVAVHTDFSVKTTPPAVSSEDGFLMMDGKGSSDRGKVGFLSQYVLKGKRLVRSGGASLTLADAQHVFGKEVRALSDLPIQWLDRMMLRPAPVPHRVLLFNPRSGVLLMEDVTGDERRPNATQLNPKKTWYTFLERETGPDGAVYRNESPVVDGIVGDIQADRIRHEIWVVRNMASPTSTYFPVRDRDTGKNLSEHFPRVDVLDQSLKYRYTMVLRPPPGLVHFSISRIAAVRDGEMVAILALDDKDSRSGIHMKFVRMRIHEVQ